MFDPPTELGRLREETPLSRLRFADGHVGWLVTSYELARQVLGDGRFSLHPFRPVLDDPEQEYPARVERMRSHARLTEVFDRYVSGGRAAHEALEDPEVVDILRSGSWNDASLTTLDGPRHDWMRRIVAPYFTPKRVNQQREMVEDIVAQRLDAMQEAVPSVDLVEMFCLPIPSLVICWMLGAPPEESHRFQKPSRVMDDPEATTEERIKARRAFDDFARELIRRKRINPGDDLLSALVQDGQLSEDELVSLATVLFNAGHDTTANMLALSVLVLLQDRTRWDALRADSTIAATAVEELLRFMTVVQSGALPRTALEDVEIGGQTIFEGEAVHVSLSAANRDQDRFADPDRFDLARKDAPGHLAFGHGIHQCLGQHFVRLELKVALIALASRFPDLRLAVPVDEVTMGHPEGFLHRVERLPVTWGGNE